MAPFIIVFLFGLIFGSFFNVCIHRLPSARRMSLISPASHCPKCGKPISWFDNIPIISYVLLLGKCRVCKNPISLRYPLVELLTALLFTFAFSYHFGLLANRGIFTTGNITNFIISIYLISVLIIITFIDFEFQEIPDELSLPGIPLAILVGLIFPGLFGCFPFWLIKGITLSSLLSVLLGILVGGGVVYLVGVVGKIVFRKEAMGFGDVKLMAMLGGFLGAESILYVFFLGCFFGAMVGVANWLITKKHYLPFGPYLGLAALVLRFFKPEVVTFATQTYPDFIRNLFAVR